MTMAFAFKTFIVVQIKPYDTPTEVVGNFQNSSEQLTQSSKECRGLCESG